MKLIRNKRAVSAVISNMILIAAVIVVGLSAYGYSLYISASYQKQYAQSVNSNIQQMKENIVFEYVVYDDGVLKGFILNCGAIDNVTIRYVKVYADDNVLPEATYEVPNVNLIITFTGLNINQRGIVQLSGLSPPSGKYRFEIDTWRGSQFVGST